MNWPLALEEERGGGLAYNLFSLKHFKPAVRVMALAACSCGYAALAPGKVTCLY